MFSLRSSWRISITTVTQLLKSWMSSLAATMISLGALAVFNCSAFASPNERYQYEVPAAIDTSEKQLSALHVMGLGVAVEKLRQRHAWDALKEASGRHGSVLPQDPKAYPWSRGEKYAVSDKRSEDVLEHAASWFVWKWPIPVFLVGPSSKKPDSVGILMGNPGSAGLHWHTFVRVDTVLDPVPEIAVAKIFDFFDNNPQVPAVLVMAKDGEVIRDIFRAPGTPSTVVSRYRDKSDSTETMTGFLLAKRERVDRYVRPWALDDEAGQQDGYNELDRHYRIARANQFWKSDMHPSAEEWLTHVAKFQPKVPQPGFVSTPWLALPWTKKQLARFDKLPVLGQLHRPYTARFTDDHGKPLSEQKKAEAFKTAWQSALATLPEGQVPTRLLFDYGLPDKGARIVPMARALAELDSPLDPMEQGINVTDRFGDMGAATPFAQVALGVMAGWDAGGISASVTLRDDGRATVIMVSPPAEKKSHPAGSDPIGWKFRPTPKPAAAVPAAAN